MTEYYEFEVSLCRVTPKIWRRFLLERSASFLDLHEAIQTACGWGNCHLFDFREPGRHGETIAGIPDEEGDFDDIPNAAKVSLSDYFEDQPKTKCIYMYDFGDSWEHEVTLRGVVTMDEDWRRKLLDGKRAFPLDDCGGLHGYYHLIDVLNGAEDPDDIRAWMGDWQPDAFNLEELRSTFDLKAMPRRKRRTSTKKS